MKLKFIMLSWIFTKLPSIMSGLRIVMRFPTGMRRMLTKKSTKSLPASANSTRLVLLCIKSFKLTFDEIGSAVSIFTENFRKFYVAVSFSIFFVCWIYGGADKVKFGSIYRQNWEWDSTEKWDRYRSQILWLTWPVKCK